jgi:hypothetical protein
MSDRQRGHRRRNAIYRKGLLEGFRLGQDAAIREAMVCALSWDRESRIAAKTVADQIAKIAEPRAEIQLFVDNRTNGEKDV